MAPRVMLRIVMITASIWGLSSMVHAQQGLDPAQSSDPFSNPLPHDVRDFERSQAEHYDFGSQFSSSDRGFTTPPAFDGLRNMAEWEEVEVLTVGWEGYSEIEKQIVSAAVLECQVFVLTEDPAWVEDYLTTSNAGGPALSAAAMENISIMETDLNTVWIRDYGPNTVYGTGVDDRLIVDWIYNRPRPDDDMAPQLIADEMGIDLYETTAAPTDLMNTGGNYMSDGFGTAFASNLVITENDGGNTWWGPAYPDQSPEEIDAIFSDFMGIERLIRMDVLPYDGIHHIDMHMKLIDEETLLVAAYPEGVADGPQIIANIEYVVSNFPSKWGTPYEVVHIPSPPDNGWGSFYPDQGGDYMTYTNSVFVNNTILLPTYYEAYDTIAIGIYESLLPGYDVVGIPCNDIISASGAIHCITHTVGVEDPLLISHQALDDTEETETPYEVVALAQHRLGVESTTLHWRLEGATDYADVEMGVIANDLWGGYIPAQAEGSVVEYYVSAVASDGKTQQRPMPAPVGYWTFRVGTIDGIETVAGSSRLSARFDAPYPNPASAITCVPLELSRRATGQLVLRDAAGRIVDVLHEGNFPSGEKKYFLNAAPLSAGAYVLTLELEAYGTWSQRLMVR